MEKEKTKRYFEVTLKNGYDVILSEDEIEKYRSKILEVKTQVLDKEKIWEKK